MKLELGQVMITKGVWALMETRSLYKDFVINCLERHSEGDWGEVSEKDWKANDKAAKRFKKVTSIYRDFGTEIWIITEGDRSTTTILYPEEF